MQLQRRAFTLGLPWTAWGQPADTLLMVAEVDPPYVLPARHPLGKGIDIDLAEEALRLGAGPSLRLQLVPFRRALAMLERQEADLTVALRRTPERERFLNFSRTYGEEVKHQFLCSTDSRVQLRRLQDLRGLRVGLVRGFAYPPALAATLGPPEAWASWANSKEALLRMVAAGHVDVGVMNAVVADWLRAELQLESVLRVEALELRSGTATQMAFSRRPAALAALAAMDRGLAQLERSGWARFQARYQRTDRKP